jgi:hypothetical protein
MNKKLVLTILTVLAALTLAACAPRASTILSLEEGTAYAAEVDEIVENMIIGDSTCDYAMFTRNLSPESLEGIPDKSAWQQHCEESRGVYGAYLSKTLDHVEDRGKNRVVIYRVVFENDPDVTLRVYFRSDDPDHQIVDIEWQVE